MKKEKKLIGHFLFTILVLTFSLSFISSVLVDMPEEFNRGETLIAKLEGNFVEPIYKENVHFYKNNFGREITMEPHSIQKVKDYYYLYAWIGNKSSGNYSLSLEDIKYKKGISTSEEDIIKNFTILEEWADFNIKPGFIITDDDFNVELLNLQDIKKNISISTNTKFGSEEDFWSEFFGGDIQDSEEYNFELKSGGRKLIEFRLNNIERPSLKTLSFSSDNMEYKMSVYVTKNIIRDENQKVDFKLRPSTINKSIITGESSIIKVYLENLGEVNMKNISLEASPKLKTLVNFSLDNIEELEPNTSIEIELDIKAPREKGSERGQIKAKYNNSYYTYSSLFLYFVESIVNQSSYEDEDSGGFLNISEDEDKDNEDSNTGKIIGWLLIGIVVVFIGWFYFKKYKGTSKGGSKKGILDLFKKSK